MPYCVYLIYTGDDGVSGYNARGSPSMCGYGPQFPTSSPYVLSVGATMVYMKSVYTSVYTCIIFFLYNFVRSSGLLFLYIYLFLTLLSLFDCFI